MDRFKADMLFFISSLQCYKLHYDMFVFSIFCFFSQTVDHKMPPPVPNEPPVGNAGYPVGGVQSYPSAPAAGQDKSPPPPYSVKPGSPSKYIDFEHICSIT